MGKRLLIIEDNEMNRDMLSRRLKRRGYEILIAEDGQAGVEIAMSEMPDLILMDMNLPIMDGWEATKKLKEEEKTREIPVIALTAHAMNSDREEILKAGCDEYEAKPVNFEALIEKIESFSVAG